VTLSKYSKINSNEIEMIRLKDDIPVLDGSDGVGQSEFEGFEERNNFIHINFFKFEVIFE
jgi:hypothetical protein